MLKFRSCFERVPEVACNEFPRRDFLPDKERWENCMTDEEGKTDLKDAWNDDKNPFKKASKTVSEKIIQTMKKRRDMGRTARVICCAWAAMALSISTSAASKIRITEPECCNITNPLGVERPSFGWKLRSDKHGDGQTAYQIQVAASPARIGKADVWNTGKVNSDQQFGIPMDGINLKAGETYFWRVKVWDADGKPSGWSEVQQFSMGLLSETDWDAEWITYPWTQDLRMPCMRKEFTAGGKVARATAYICGIGASDLYINGALADPTRILDPAQTNYEQYALYSTIDVTKLVRNGENCIGVMLADGWFNQRTVFTDFSYGRPMLRMQVILEYSNGRKAVVGTDESWLWKEGPVVKANIYSGEVYDARMEVRDWAEHGTETSGWQKVKLAAEAVPPVTRSQLMPAIRIHETLPAVHLWQGKDGKWLYDFGTNNTADILLKVNLPEGTRVTVRTAEETYPDRQSLDFRSSGTAVVPVQTDEYVCAGNGEETWMPRFTYHGFRYAEVSFSDASIQPEKEWLSAVLVHTDLARKASFKCSDPQINRLHEMNIRTVQGNIVGVPMDCPTREKCGWLGDIHAYIKMFCDNYETDNFLDKYLDDIHSGAKPEWKNTLHHLLRNTEFYNADKASGIPFMIAPGKRLCGVASPDWGTAVVQLPWHMYLYNGNREALARNYGHMKQWTDYITSISIDHIVYQGLGDWAPPMGNPCMTTPVPFTSSAFHYYDVTIMADVAKVLGNTADADRYSQEKEAIKQAMIRKFFLPELNTFGSQTADAMALDLGICPDGMEEQVALGLVRNIRLARNFFDTGIFGLCRIGSALSRNAQARKAFSLFTKKGKWSFAYMWERYDATTMWEVLPVTDHNPDEIQTCSHCHPMQAGLDIWFYEDLAGIRPVAEHPGFKKILLQPCFEVDLESAEATIGSRYGSISSSWKKNGSTISWDVVIPTGSSARIVLDAGRKIAGLNATPDGSYDLASGSYSLTVESQAGSK